MENDFKILLNNAFLYEKSLNNLAKNYSDLNSDELEIFENFLRHCYKTINYRNKESWWTKGNPSKKINTDTAKFFEQKGIWHLHINEYLTEDLNGKTINYQIYPGKTAKYIICFHREEINSLTLIHILSFSSHPHGITWEEIENHISQIKYF